MIFMASCGFNNKFDVPSEITGNVTVQNSTHTVRHEVVVSVEMTEMFENECAVEADGKGLVEPLRSEYISLCVNKKTTDFINSILTIINSQQGSNREKELL